LCAGLNAQLEGDIALASSRASTLTLAWLSHFPQSVNESRKVTDLQNSPLVFGRINRPQQVRS